MKITTDYLNSIGACGEGIDEFDDVFPDGAEINRDNLSKAIDCGLDVVWLISRLDDREVLAELGKDEYDSVREGVASNPSTPPATLVELSKDEAWEVREGVASNPSTPTATTIEELAR